MCAVFLHATCRVKLWASAFGGEMKSISAKYSGSQLLQKVRFKCHLKVGYTLELQFSAMIIQMTEPEFFLWAFEHLMQNIA